MERKSPAPKTGTKTEQQAQIAYYEDGSLIDLETSDTRLWISAKDLSRKKRMLTFLEKAESSD